VRLTPIQWLVMAAILVMFGCMVLDILGLIAPPEWVWIVAPLTLWLVSWFTLPTMSELKKANRRG